MALSIFVKSSLLYSINTVCEMATDVASKHELIKTRRNELLVVEKQVDSLVRTWAADEAPARKGCFPLFTSCVPFWRKHRAVSTAVLSSTNESADGREVKQSGESNKLLMRMLGARKQHTNEAEKIGTAIEMVQLRVESLSDRVKICRERALRSKNDGKREEALRELKKAKTLEKQLGAARAALDTLERQQDIMAESTLQRELATALKSTTAGVKANSKGLLAMAEQAIDNSIEVRDDVEDVAAVFEGITPYESVIDENELLEELDDLTSESVGYTSEPAVVVASEVAKPAEPAKTEQVSGDLFPSVPGVLALPKPVRGNERASLLSGV